MNKKNMKRYGQIIKLKPEGREEYIRHHAETWSGVLKQIEKSNIRNYSIFERNNFLFAYFEYIGEDFEKDMEAMAADPETQRWWSVVRPLCEAVDDAPEGAHWTDLTEVFHCD